MVCPFCNTEDTAVIDSRKNSEGTSVRRRRKCPKCNSRFTTYEKTEIELIVEKRSGNLEEF
ncbi:MAG: transcriptional regulator NrdR, partial [Actinomycetota bacterium]|nr:transcriptional regulator NrdR [Actinomycetota bacterium]